VKQEFFNPTLEGERFQDHTVPLELFKDFSALQEMLIEVAKWEFRKSHPNRERIPRNFTSGLDLHLEAVGEGSAILKISLVFASLFPTSNLSYFEQAKTDIVDAVAAVEAGRAPSLPPRYLNYFDRFGRGLRSGESISFQNGEGKATLTPETRQQLMRYAETKEWTEEAVLRVRVPEADKGRNSFEMELNDGSKLSGNLNDLYRDAVLQAFHNYKTGTDEYVLVQGIVRKDRDGHLRGFESIEHATPLDPQDVTLRLEELAALQNGWLDGTGVAPNKDALPKLARLFDTSFDSDLPLPFLYPTPEGGLQAEWNLGDWSVTLEIELEHLGAAYHALDLKTGASDELTLSLDSPAEWARLNGILKNLEKQNVEEHQIES
jgi:hypothetical protein